MKRARVPGTAARRVRALFVVPSPAAPGLTAAERLALTLRRDATIAGRCACGAVAPKARVKKGSIVVVPIEHAEDCPAASRVVDELARRLGDQVEYELVGVEVEVAA